ncbi:DUF1624 domain-containing protein [Deminuibacter soli]|uniref:DUF1624 domain-containing protein n=1 Tax=Deminuibacter soli TaxID=2291815 RepID=A0A3E1NK08_9BACT|nr:heparan-alpha-glucosaminide N-acetyltransferase domain-containing protein [Deminuibacter soli]RFM28211.1 DUF1624 domain-containing protein [Deminuibacter soli]
MQPAARERIYSIDLLRGLIMVIMALDHVRDFFHHVGGMASDPTNLATTTPILFFTRFITHYCAPTFLFLSGVSAFLSGQRKTKKEQSGFLLKRGIWLLFVEIFLITFAIAFNPDWSFVLLQVIWAIGWSMIVLAVLIWLPLPVIGIIGLLLVLCHDTLDGVQLQQGSVQDALLKITLTASGFGINWHNHFILVAYAILPWTGIMLIGYTIGSLYKPSFNAAQRKKILLGIGIAALMLFVVLRSINQYGDPSHWSVQKNGLFTFLSFINVSKYPPSLLYACITLGPSIIFLALTEKATGKLVNILSVYGRVPFFYYVCHFYLIRLFCIISFYLQGFGSADIHSQPFTFLPPAGGYNLFVVYLIWLFLVAVLYLPCRWFDRYKQNHREKWWLSYL